MSSSLLRTRNGAYVMPDVLDAARTMNKWLLFLHKLKIISDSEKATVATKFSDYMIYG